jgi:hypothetical protein
MALCAGFLLAVLEKRLMFWLGRFIAGLTVRNVEVAKEQRLGDFVGTLSGSLN